jgi:uncharacterized protein YbjT (DUF2867 family)
MLGSHMSEPERSTAVVTGAFGFTGRAIATGLLAAGWTVRTITGLPPGLNPFGDCVRVLPYRFDDPEALSESFSGAAAFFNTYWIRFPHGRVTFETAIGNSEKLIRAAAHGGVRRIVHMSVSNASEHSPLPYFRGKALVEKAVTGSGLSYAILRPTVIFGRGDILINNIAWLLRRFPVFAIPGSGRYRVQPIFIEDLAQAALEAAQSSRNEIVDCAGPDVFTFEELVRAIAQGIGRPARPLNVPLPAALLAVRAIGLAVRDVVLTREEIAGLMADLLVARAHPAARTPLTAWLKENGAWIGREYASELGRHFRR